MSPKLEQELYKKYPYFFSHMQLGIECDDGWYDLLSAVCWRISQYEKNITKKVDTNYISVKFNKIKKGLGELRISYDGGDNYVDGVITLASEMSGKICEKCGNAGTLIRGLQIVTLCKDCKNKTL
jgi:hypothetical protein